jgi:hypothetical protein
VKGSTPTLEGFRAILLRPSFGLAEIAWRWSFAAAAGLLLCFSAFEYLDTLPVSKGDLFLLRSSQPALISRAMLHIFRGSAFRVVEAAVVLGLMLGVCWIVVASLARLATIRALLSYFRENEILPPDLENQEGASKLWSLFALNFFRLAATLAAAAGCLAAALLGGAVTRPSDPAPGSALLIVLALTMLVWIAWSAVNWFLSVAAIFVVAHGQDTFGAIAAAVNLCQTRVGSVLAAGIWFGLAHLMVLVISASMVAFPLGFAGDLPAAVVFGGVLLVTLLYSTLADFLYIGRLAAYTAIVELSESPSSAEIVPPQLPQGGPYFESPSSRAVDATELILSDLPAIS